MSLRIVILVDFEAKWESVKRKFVVNRCQHIYSSFSKKITLSKPIFFSKGLTCIRAKYVSMADFMVCVKNSIKY